MHGSESSEGREGSHCDIQDRMPLGRHVARGSASEQTQIQRVGEPVGCCLTLQNQAMIRRHA